MTKAMKHVIELCGRDSDEPCQRRRVKLNQLGTPSHDVPLSGVERLGRRLLVRNISKWSMVPTRGRKTWTAVAATAAQQMCFPLQVQAGRQFFPVVTGSSQRRRGESLGWIGFLLIFDISLLGLVWILFNIVWEHVSCFFPDFQFLWIPFFLFMRNSGTPYMRGWSVNANIILNATKSTGGQSSRQICNHSFGCLGRAGMNNAASWPPFWDVLNSSGYANCILNKVRFISLARHPVPLPMAMRFYRTRRDNRPRRGFSSAGYHYYIRRERRYKDRPSMTARCACRLLTTPTVGHAEGGLWCAGTSCRIPNRFSETLAGAQWCCCARLSRQPPLPVTKTSSPDRTAAAAR